MIYRAKSVYHDRTIVETYDARRFIKIKGRITNYLELRLIYKALRAVNIFPPASILDVPCGTGRLTLFLSKKGYSVIGVDISPEMIRLTNEKLIKSGLNRFCPAIIGNAESLQFHDNSFDAVISLRLLGHVPPLNRRLILRELGRVSKKYIILAYYDRACLQHLLRKRRRRFDEWYPVGYKEIRSELKSADLSIVKIIPLFFKISETIIALAIK